MTTHFVIFETHKGHTKVVLSSDNVTIIELDWDYFKAPPMTDGDSGILLTEIRATVQQLRDLPNRENYFVRDAIRELNEIQRELEQAHARFQLAMRVNYTGVTITVQEGLTEEEANEAAWKAEEAWPFDKNLVDFVVMPAS